MEVFTSPADMRAWSDARRASGGSIGFVPTMGALHAGHERLLVESALRNDSTVLSVFVNPIQFNNPSDLAAYPRTTDDDLQVARQNHVHAVFLPSTEDMYPEGFDTAIHVGRVGDFMEGAKRPGHFDGVATVVTKLFNAVAPHRAYFGTKDFQQLAVIRALVRDLNLPVEIVAVDTVREPDGLALSSRNARLTPEDRRAASVLFEALSRGTETFRNGETQAAKILESVSSVLRREPRCRVEYVEVADALSLSPVDNVDHPAVVCLAAWFGDVRLIDNVQLTH